MQLLYPPKAREKNTGCHGIITGLSRVRHGFGKHNVFLKTRGFSSKNHGLTRDNHGFDTGLSRVIGALNHGPELFLTRVLNVL